jgi:hypothetical protein
MAQIHDRTLAKPVALRWIERALEANPAESRPVQTSLGRQVARHGVGVFAGEIRDWIGALPSALRDSPLVREMVASLDAHAERDARRRRAYLRP